MTRTADVPEHDLDAAARRRAERRSPRRAAGETIAIPIRKPAAPLTRMHDNSSTPWGRM